MINLFKRPRSREVYAVTAGAMLGELWIFCKKEKSSLFFLSIPDNFNREVSRKKFDIGIKAGILQYIEKIPRDIYKESLEQFKVNESNNRCQQCDTPNVLGVSESRILPGQQHTLLDVPESTEGLLGPDEADDDLLRLG